MRGFFLISKCLFLFPCLQILFQQDFNKSLESDFEGEIKSNWWDFGLVGKGWEAMPQGESMDHPGRTHPRRGVEQLC